MPVYVCACVRACICVCMYVCVCWGERLLILRVSHWGGWEEGVEAS